MLKVLTMVTSLLVLLPGRLAWSDASQPRHVQAGALMGLLQAPHPQIQGPALQRIGPDVPALLVEYATSLQQPQRIRLRALGWLQWFPSSQSKAVLLEAMRARNVDTPTLRVGVRALAVGFGAEMLPVVREYLEHKNVHVREAAAYAMGDIDDRRVRDILTDHLEREKDLTVRDATMEGLRKVSARESAGQKK